MSKILTSLLLGSIPLMLSSLQAKAAEIRIIAKPANTPLMGLGTNPGHVTIAFYDDNGKLQSTKGFWPTDKDWKNEVRENDKNDMGMGEDVGKGFFTNYCGWYGCGERRARISNARLNWLKNVVATKSGTGCQSYQFVGKSLTHNQCNCVTFAARVWRIATADQERFFDFTPTDLKTTLIFRKINTKTVYSYSGQTWTNAGN